MYRSTAARKRFFRYREKEREGGGHSAGRMKSRTATLAVGILLLVALVVVAEADTDAGDGNASFSRPRRLLGLCFSRQVNACVIGVLLVLAVAALGNLYSSWNSPAQLTGWSASGGDPCGAAWTGVSCSGSAVTSMYSQVKRLFLSLTHTPNLRSHENDRIFHHMIQL